MKRYLLAVFVFAFAFTIPVSAQVVDEAVEEEAVDEAVNGVALNPADNTMVLKASLDKELKLLKKLAKLSDDTIAGLKLGMEPLIKAEAKRQSEAQNGAIFISGMNTLPAKLLKSVAEAAKSVVEDEKAYQAYRDDVELRLNFERSVAVNGLVQAVDSLVGLTSKQIPAVEKIAGQLFEAGKVNAMSMMNVMGQGTLPLKATDFKDALTESQKKYFKTFNSNQNNIAYLMPTDEAEEDAEKKRERLTGGVREVGNMKVEQLSAELGLTAKQKRKLELVTKSIISKSVDRKLEAEAEYRKWIQIAQAGNVNEQPDPEMMSLAMAGPVTVFESEHKRWDKYLKGTLTKEQLATWNQRIETRKASGNTTLGYMLVMAFGSQLEMTGKQQVATHKLISKSLTFGGSFMNTFGMLDSYRGLLAIPEKDFVEAMGADNWKTFEPQLDQLRQQLDMMEQQRKKKEAEPAEEEADR